MDEVRSVKEMEDLKEKRRLQNRSSQRRFRSRKKESNRNFELQLQKGGAIEFTASTDKPMTIQTPASSWNLYEEPDGSRPNFSEDMDYRSMSYGESLGEQFVNHSGDFDTIAWLNSPSMLSPPHDEHSAIPATYFESRDRKSDQAVNDTIASPNFQHKDSHTPTYSASLKFPEITKSTKEIPTSTHLSSEGGMEFPSTSTTDPNRFGDRDRSHGYAHSSQSFQIYAARTNSTCGESKEQERPSCCVAHKAGVMIADVQKLCKFGVRFGLLVTEDNELQDTLTSLRRKLQGMAQCSNEEVYYSSSGSSDVF